MAAILDQNSSFSSGQFGAILSPGISYPKHLYLNIFFYLCRKWEIVNFQSDKMFYSVTHYFPSEPPEGTLARILNTSKTHGKTSRDILAMCMPYYDVKYCQ